jgi:hypothetical protein
MSHQKSFASEKAFSTHFQRSPPCLAFVRQEEQSTIARPAGLKRFDEMLDETICSSSKRPKQLRCNVVNDRLANFATNISIPALPNSTLEIAFLDDNDKNANFDDEMTDVDMPFDDDSAEGNACPTQQDTMRILPTCIQQIKNGQLLC